MTIEILRRKEVERVTGLSRSTIYKRIKEGSFPKPLPLGGRLVGWKASDIQDWINNLANSPNSPEKVQGV